MNSNQSYSPETLNSGQNQRFFCTVWPWNLTDDLEKLQGTSSMLLQALCIISSSYVNSNCSYSPETVKLGYDLCDLDLWTWPFVWASLLSLVITPENFVMIQWWEHSQKGVTDRRTDRQTDRRTDWTICRAAWSQLKYDFTTTASRDKSKIPECITFAQVQ